MAALTVLNSPISPLYEDESGTIMVPRIAGATFATSGLACCEDPTTRKVLVADPTVSGAEQFAGLVLESKRNGQCCSVLRAGAVAGFDLSAINVGTLVYLDTAGGLNTTANGTKTVPVGKVVTSSLVDADGTIRKALWIFVNPLLVY